MLKKFFYSMMAVAMLATTSCTDDPMIDGGEEATVSFTIGTPEIATRAYSDGTTATQLQYAVYDADGNYISGASNGGVSYDTVEKTIEVPEGAKYFRVMWMNTTHSRYDAATYGVEANFYCYGELK